MDQLERGISRDHRVRVVAATTTSLVRDACGRHDLRGAEAVVLGRALTAGCLLATLTKRDDERVRISMRGGGPVGQILVDSRSDGTVRGCLGTRLKHSTDPLVLDGRASVAGFVGRHGQLVVTRDVGLEHEYQGVVAVESGEIDRDLERYLQESEQLPSALQCEVLLDRRGEVMRAAGVLCQTFPEAEDGSLDEIRDNLRGTSILTLLRQDRSPRELMGFALLGQEYDVAGDPTDLAFLCTCSEDRALSVISTLGADDLETLASEPGPTEVTCSYCGRAYELSAKALINLAAQLRKTLS